ncbi:MAG: hypothetical protein QM791_12465 [Ferruginibacter sp.]
MKQALKLILLFAALPFVVPAQPITEITTYKMGGVNSEEFTTDNFKCINIGKGNVIWAGTQYGGLYMYSDDYNIWRKSTRLTNVFINDIKSDPDSGIWIAQSGTASQGGNSNIAGGVNYFRVGSDLSMEFYSVQGTTTSADLLSRNVRSLYVDPNFKVVNNQLPRVWAAQGTFITSYNTKKGGLGLGVKSLSPFFTNISTGFSSLQNATPYCEVVGGNRDEVWAGVRMNTVNDSKTSTQILRYKPTGEYIGLYDTTKTTLPLNFTPQAIFFDSRGNRWVGLKAGGLVIKTPEKWVTMNASSLLPSGSQINYNAIAEDEFGNVYIGTSNGLIEYMSPDYNASSSPDYLPSYKLYTTIDGLPDNNVTGIAYDKGKGRLLVTSSGGVTFIKKREPHIRGVVYDAKAWPDSANPYPGLQKKPLRGGLITAVLLKDGVEEDYAYPGLDGVFEFTKAKDDVVYTVEIKFTRNNRTIKYLYNNIRNHTLMQPVLIPDGLIEEIKAFRESMEKRCFPLKVTFGAELNLDFFCAKGFNTSLYENPFDEFYKTDGINADHTKKVERLASYFLAMKTVYKLGGDATDLFTDMIANAIDAVQSLAAFVDLGTQIKNESKLPDDPLEKSGIETAGLIKALMGQVKFIKEGVNHGISKLSQKIDDPEKKKMLDKCVGLVNDAADLCIYFLEDGKEGLAVNFFMDNLKKVVALAVSVQYYGDDYTGERHKYFVPTASINVWPDDSGKTYAETFDMLYSQTANSLGKNSTDTLANRKSIIETASRISKYAEATGQVFDGARTIAVIPGAQQAAAVFTGLSILAKATRTFALATATYFGAVGCMEIEEMSDQVLQKTTLKRPAVKEIQQRPAAPLQDIPTQLVVLKDDYNLKLTELQAVYSAAYNVDNYKTKYNAFIKADSLYSIELNRTLHKLASSAGNANANVPGFTGRFDKIMDSFITQQYTMRHALFYRNLAYVYDPVKTNHSAGLDSLTKDIRLLNDSSVAGIMSLVTSINNNGIGSPAYLVEDSLRMTHSHAPGSGGTLRFYFTNYGAEAQNNVRFKIKMLSGGYAIAGADSVNVGSIAAGATKTVSFNFVSPSTDSLGCYFIDVMADNGNYKDVYGTLVVQDPQKFFSVKDGNWNTAATWNKNAVPAAANSVYITHNVTVTANADCKGIMVNKPGKVTVNTGVKVSVQK